MATYREAGVDIDAGEALVDAIKPFARATARPGSEPALGGYGALLDLKAAGFEDPLVVTTTDGVGTKLLIAQEVGRHDSIGIDLVAMCVNDLIAQGATPLQFLDYYASSKLDVPAASQVIRGIAEGCKLAGCALVGGETAEMPGMYAPGHYDVAGFAVGAIERRLLRRSRPIEVGDVIVGLPSSGCHSNGYSLVRDIVARSGLAWSDPAPFAEASMAEEFLRPTRIYRAVLEVSPFLLGTAHITGGGLVRNLPRILPPRLGARLDARTWTFPPAMGWMMSAGAVGASEMASTFNCGLGMVLVCGPEVVYYVTENLRRAGQEPVQVGTVTDRPGIEIQHMDDW